MINKVKSRFEKKAITTLVMVAVLFVSIFGTALPAKADVLQGLGTAADPFIITTAERLASIPSIGLDKYYKLANDIDLSTYGQWAPIGNTTNNFKGNFNGNGHKITGIKIGTLNNIDTPKLGLFGNIANATISNLGVSAEISSSGNYIGCLVGLAMDSTITNCFSIAELNCTGSTVGGLVGASYRNNIKGCISSGTVKGMSDIGGLIGSSQTTKLSTSYSEGTVSGTGNTIGGLIGSAIYSSDITDCHSSETVSGTSIIGGLIGNLQNSRVNSSYSVGTTSGTGNYIGGLMGMVLHSDIIGCYSYETVTGVSFIGGLIGNLDDSKLNSSYSAGTVSGTGDSTGGLVAYISSCDVDSFVRNCYSASTVNGNKNVGGLVGWHCTDAKKNNTSYIVNCYATGNVEGSLYVGGFAGSCFQYDNQAGKSYNQIINCYSSGKVKGTNIAGGFSGCQLSDPTIKKSYWCNTNSPSTSLDVASKSGECDVSSLTSANMQKQSFAETLNNNINSLKLSDCATWRIVETRNNGYPILDGVGDGDTALPSGSYTLSTTESTSGSVTINFTAKDDNSGVKSITLPDNTVVTAINTTYTVSLNGTYKFIVTDNAGNTSTVSVIVSNIVQKTVDTTAPSGTYELSTIASTTSPVTINIKATDEDSGVKSITLPDNTVVAAANATYTVSTNGTYKFIVADNEGNTTQILVPVTNIKSQSTDNPTTDDPSKDNPTTDNPVTGNPTTDDPSTGDSDGTDVSDIPSVVDIVMSKSSSYAITAFGEVYSWGHNNCGQLGLGNTKSTTTPTKISGLSDVEQIVVNDNYSVYAITVNGDVYAWGYNKYGQLGIGNTKTMTKPVKIAGLTNVTSIIVKDDSVFAFTSDDETFAWGNNAYGKLGIKGAKIITKPTKVQGIVGF